MRTAGHPAHHIDNLERAMRPDIVKSEVKTDYYCCLPFYNAG
jgi:hypothetical protein